MRSNSMFFREMLFCWSNDWRGGSNNGRGGPPVWSNTEGADFRWFRVFIDVVFNFVNVSSISVQIYSFDNIFLWVKMWHVNIIPQLSSVHGKSEKMVQNFTIERRIELLGIVVHNEKFREITPTRNFSVSGSTHLIKHLRWIQCFCTRVF